MIADVVFDVPLLHPFSYRVADSLSVAPGQRVLAPLGAARRVGMVVAVREGDAPGLKPLHAAADAAPVLDGRRLDLARWIADESLSSLGSTLAALLPPPHGGLAPAAGEATIAGGAAAPQLLVGAGRERRVMDRLETAPAALMVVPDIEAAARWAQRLARRGPVARLDSGVDDAERAAGWTRLASGAARVAVGTRSALLAPLPPAATLVVLDEHEAAHKPPGPPRMHSRDVVLERAARDGLAALFTAATPSVEMWWRARDTPHVTLTAAPPARWPAVTLADTRGILKREPLTPPLARAIREALAGGRRVFLGISRLASALACDECGEIVRCPQCAIALAYARSAAALTCRLCGTSVALMDTCPACRGRRLSPFGWGAERVEHAVRRRFPQARVARYDPDATRGARGEAQRAAAAHADVVIGTRGALRLFGPGSLGLAGFVTPDQLLRLPDFRAGERMFALLWAAAERVVADGALVIQSQNPAHYAFAAVARQELATFYDPELKFRAELGYPPFRRLALISVEDGAGQGQQRAAAVVSALTGVPGVVAYPPAVDRRGRAWRVVVKGPPDLPRALAGALGPLRAAPGARRGIIEVEVDPVEWRS